MDSNQLKSSSSSSEDQIDMMLMMMMQLPEFSSSNNNNNEFPPSDHDQFYKNTRPLADLIDNPPNPIPSSFNHLQLPTTSTNTISFTHNNSTPLMFQDQQQQQQQTLFSNSTNEVVANPYGVTPAEKRNSMAAMREMIFRIAAMQPIYIDPESVKAPKRRNVKISKDPQSIAARHRRERISEKIRILQRMVPGGTKMDTASMLDEAIHYVKFLKSQVKSLQERAANNNNRTVSGSGIGIGIGFPVSRS